MYKRFSQFAFGCMLLFALQAGAQTLAGKFSQVPQYMRIQKNEQVSVDKFPDWLAQHYSLPEGNGFKLLSTEKDNRGMVHYRYQQTVNGIPVEFTMYLLHTRNGMIESMSGDIVDKLSASMAPMLSEEEAISAAVKHVDAVEYKWQTEGAEEALQENSGNPNATYYPQPQLVYLAKDNKLGESVFNLAYRIDIYAVKPFSRQFIYVDALSGEVLYTRNRIQHANATASAHTQYSGVQTVVTDSINATTYRLRETGRGNGIRTYNARRTTNPSNTDFFNATKVWNNVNDSLDEYATDAHYASEMTYDFYMNNFGRNSIDGNGLILAAYVHFGVDYDNAFWDGGAMNYGDGSNQNNTTPYTPLDIGGHEITHGLTQFTADLIYENESGALNESFSDIMGVSVRQYARQLPVVDYVLGDQNGPPFRSMKNPKNYGDPDTYEGTYWITDTFDNGGVHINSGVQNHWFYMVAQGEAASNDNGQAYNITGIGITSAQAIAYRTLTVYLTPTSQYADARKYSIKATEDLFGACSPEVKVVTNAWYAAGVGNPFVQEVNTDFNTPVTNYCGVPATVAFIDSSTNAMYHEWTFGDGSTSNQQNPAHTYTSYGTYDVKLMSWSPDCGRDSIIKQQYITINDFTPVATSGVEICSGAQATLSATGAGELTWFETPTGGTPVYSGSTFVTPALGQTTTYYVENQNPGPVAWAGPASINFGAGGNNNSDHYLIFNNTKPNILVSVLVNASSAGNRTIELRDASNNILQSTTVYVASGDQTVPLNFYLPVKSGLRLGIWSGTAALYRNSSGATYPYVSTDGSLSIVSNDVGSQERYYFFYNWQLRAAPCVSVRVPVTANVVCTDINEPLVLDNIVLTPNPAISRLNLAINQVNLPGNSQVTIRNILGEILIHQNLEMRAGNNWNFDVSALPAGVYMLTLETDGNMLTRRFVKK